MPKIRSAVRIADDGYAPLGMYIKHERGVRCAECGFTTHEGYAFDACTNEVCFRCGVILAMRGMIRAIDEAEHQFKNFHRLLCERFGYTHDEQDWRRDQASLIEHVASRVAQPVEHPATDSGEHSERCGAVAGSSPVPGTNPVRYYVCDELKGVGPIEDEYVIKASEYDAAIARQRIQTLAEARAERNDYAFQGSPLVISNRVPEGALYLHPQTFQDWTGAPPGWRVAGHGLIEKIKHDD